MDYRAVSDRLTLIGNILRDIQSTLLFSVAGARWPSAREMDTVQYKADSAAYWANSALKWTKEPANQG